MSKYTYTIEKFVGGPVFGTSDGLVAKTASSIKEANGWWAEHHKELRGTYYLTRWDKEKKEVPKKGTVIRGKVLWVKKIE